MKNLNQIRYTATLQVQSQTNEPIQAFATAQNIIRVIAPYDNTWVPYAIFEATADRPIATNTQNILMTRIGEETVGQETFTIYEVPVPKMVQGSAKATKVQFIAAFYDRKATVVSGTTFTFIGIEYFDNTPTDAALKAIFTEAEENDYVRVIFNGVGTDWLFNGTTWTDTQDLYESIIQENRSDVVEFVLRKGKEGQQPTIKPDNTEAIIQALGTKADINAVFTKQQSDDRFVNVTGDTMQGTLDLNNNPLPNVQSINTYTFTNGQQDTDGIKFDMLNTLFKLADDGFQIISKEPGQTWQQAFADAIQNKFDLYLKTADTVTDLDDLFDVTITALANRHGIFYNSSSGKWENRLLQDADIPQIPQSKVTDLVSALNTLTTNVGNNATAITNIQNNFMAKTDYLDANNKIKLENLPDITKQPTIVFATTQAFDAFDTSETIAGTKAFDNEAKNGYVWDGTEWLLTTDASWENINLDWGNIDNAPKTAANTTLADGNVYTTTEADDKFETITNVETLADRVTDVENDKEDSVNIGDRQYATPHVVTSSETVTQSIQALDSETKRLDDDKEDAANIGNRTYTQENVVTNSETVTASIDALDQEVKNLDDNKMEIDASNSDVLDLKFQNQDTEDALAVGELRLNKNLAEWQISANTLHLVGRQLIERAINRTGANLVTGVPLFISGVFTPGGGPGTDQIEVGLATRSNANGVFAVASCPAPDNQSGCIITNGTVRGWDTTAFAAGDELYLTDTAGTYNVGPIGDGAAEYFVGTVIRAAADGIVRINPTEIIEPLLDAKVNKAGDTLTGDLDFDGNKALNLPEPTDNGDAANKKYVDDTDNDRKTYVDNNFVPNSKLGGTAEGNIPLLDSEGLIAPQFVGERYSDVYVGYGVFDDPQAAVPVLQELYPADQWDLQENEPIQDAEPYPKKGNTIYVTKNVKINNAFRYSELANVFVGIQPSPLALGTIAGTAYEGSAGQANRDDIDDILDGTKTVKKAEQDQNGNVIDTTYATQTNLEAATDDISDILDGTQTVKKAEQDQNGNVIDTTYATKTELSNITIDELNDIADVNVTGATNNQVVHKFIDGETQEWRAKTLTKSDVGLPLVENYQIASEQEAQTGTETERYMNPLRVAQAIAALAPDPEIATQAEAEAGTINDKFMTPLRTQQAIQELSPPTDVSTEYAKGVIEENNENNTNFWIGTQAEYDALSTYDSNTLYFIEE